MAKSEPAVSIAAGTAFKEMGQKMWEPECEKVFSYFKDEKEASAAVCLDKKGADEIIFGLNRQ